MKAAKITHRAHIYSVIAEIGLDYQKNYIGIALDGTGLGDDGRIWGGEFLIVRGTKAQRIAHLKYIPQIGGDKAAIEIERMALAYIFRIHNGFPHDRVLDTLGIPRERTTALHRVYLSNATPKTSSMGRLFDAATFIAGVCRKNSFEAEGPMRLESAVDENEMGSYPFDIYDGTSSTINFAPTIAAMLEDRIAGTATEILSARFHNSIVNGVAKMTTKLAEKYHILDVVLSGGVMQNRYLLERLIDRLTGAGLSCYFNHTSCANDQGVSLGQAFYGTIRSSE